MNSLCLLKEQHVCVQMGACISVEAAGTGTRGCVQMGACVSVEAAETGTSGVARVEGTDMR